MVTYSALSGINCIRDILPNLLVAHVDRRWEHVHSSGGRRFDHLLSFDAMNSLFTDYLTATATIKVVRGGEVISKDRYNRTTRVAGSAVDIVDRTRLQNLYSQGNTIVLQALQSFWPSLELFASELQGETGHMVHINAYLTPADAAGAGQHYDTHDVLVLQVEGSKRWELGPVGMTEPLMRHPSQKLDLPPTATIELQPGDVLYMPRGLLHKAHTSNETSLHLTIGIQTSTGIDVVDQLIEYATDDPTLREGLPIGQNDAEWSAAVDRFVERFAVWAHDDKVRQRVIEALRYPIEQNYDRAVRQQVLGINDNDKEN